jgi:hypothetical protein
MLTLGFAGICFGPAFGKKLTIRGQAIQLHGANPLTIKGSFYTGPPVQTQEVPGNDPATLNSPLETIRSHGSGGACLLADLNFKGIPEHAGTCTTDKACNDAIPQQYRGIYTDENGNDKDRDWYSNCVEGSCWTRPGSWTSHCLLSPVHNSGAPWPAGSQVFGPPPISSTVYTVADLYRELQIQPHESVNWRVHACLNGSGGFGIDNVACGGNDGTRLVHGGPPSKVP